jgi:hypothetical protein
MQELTRSCKSLQDHARRSFGQDPEKASCEIFQGLIQDPYFLRKGQKNAVSSHKTQDILPRSIKSIFQLLTNDLSRSLSFGKIERNTLAR